MATNREGTIYEGAFGERVLGGGQAMTTDTVGWIASMTKAITSVAAVQCVERGKLSLDTPASAVVPAIAEAQVLTGFDATGNPQTRPPKRPITLRHLLTHSAGFSYEIWNTDMQKVQAALGIPSVTELQEQGADAAVAVRPGRALGIRHQHRLGRQDGRGGQWAEARCVPQEQPARARWA